MFKFFRRSKTKNKSNDANQTEEKSQNKLLKAPLQRLVVTNACATTNSGDINKISENFKSADHVEHSTQVLVQNDRSNNDKPTLSKRNDFKKEKFSRNEGVEQNQCQNKDVSRRSIPIDRQSAKQDQQSESERDKSSRKISFNPISKSREFLNGIMAKGRNRHRNRNKHKESKNQPKQHQLVSKESQNNQLKYSEVSSSRESEFNKNNLSASNDFFTHENFQLGYQITRSKNSTHLVMQHEVDDGEDYNDKNNDDRGETDHNRYTSKKMEEIDSGNTSDYHEEMCASATEINLRENRNRVEQLDDCCDHIYNDCSSAEIQQQRTEYYFDRDENADDDDDDQENYIQVLSHTDKNLHDEESQLPEDLAAGQSNDESEQISELTECDRDRYFKIEMGQPVSKTSLTSNKCQDQQSTTENSDKSTMGKSHIVIPTITVADYSDHNIDSIDPEIFYDSEHTLDTDHDQTADSVSFVDLSNEKKIEEDWHFISSDSDRVIIDNDPENTDNIPSTYNTGYSNSENLSTSSSSAIENQTWFPDSGFGSFGSILVISSKTIADDSENQLNGESDPIPRGSSTDCDDNLLQSDYEILYDHNDHDDSNDQHILIDSISLPDVVVESTGMGISHSIPVKFEGTDDSTSSDVTSTSNSVIILNDHNENVKRNLINQEARFSAQLEEAQARVNDLQDKIDKLEKELSEKSWNVDRLKAELEAAHKEDEAVRRRLKNLEEEKELLRQRLTETEEELNQKYEELETEYNELQEKYQRIQSLASTLHTQLAFAQSDAEQCRQEKEKLLEEKKQELETLQEALQQSYAERKELEEKWQKEFELLRTQNADKEEHLLMDCEWQMRTMQKTCKEKIEVAEKVKKEALERAAEVEEKAKEQMEELRRLRCCEAELKQLRGLTNEQRQSIATMTEQIEELKSDLESANIQLEEQIANAKKIKRQCDNALSDKDRQMIQKIDEARGEVAVMWENRLLTEMTRLTNELESVHAEQRNEGLQKLQEEHLEEIKALTTRYTANEQELREEIQSLQRLIQRKDEDYRDLQRTTENTLLETRLYLERADRDYQCAMNREFEKREQLCEELKNEFEDEKLEMEGKFRERLSQVKEEFAKELANTTEEMAVNHRKQLEQQWEQLIAEKEEALQAMESRHRIRIEEIENRMKDLEIEHQRDLKELKNNFDIERTALESRDMQNTQEIEQLHRKCRCLTNLFEEMRMRYERRDPRPEDLREIAELRSRCEAQERDLHLLTERLREVQIQMQDKQPDSSPRKRVIRKPPPKTIPTSCDVIYEENEERDSPPLTKENVVNGTIATTNEIIENVTAES